MYKNPKVEKRIIDLGIHLITENKLIIDITIKHII